MATSDAQKRANRQYRLRNKEKWLAYARDYNKTYRKLHPLTSDQKEKANTHARVRSLHLVPLQKRTWWKKLPDEHKQLFLAEFDPQIHTINQFQAYLASKTVLTSGCYKLAKHEVIEIKQALREGVPGIDAKRIGGYLAKKYGVSRQAINLIKQGKTYKHIS